jgi:hypothetical protein
VLNASLSHAGRGRLRRAPGIRVGKSRMPGQPIDRDTHLNYKSH